nr:hypothetical protein [Paenibacillus xylanexedens]
MFVPRIDKLFCPPLLCSVLLRSVLFQLGATACLLQLYPAGIILKRIPKPVL